jgi:hypothetical protein
MRSIQMSSSSVAYVVAPNSSATTPYIPSPTQLNGTGPLVDLVPTVYDITNSPISLNDTGTTTLWTSPTLAIGVYQVNAAAQFYVGGIPSWQTNESFTLYIGTPFYNSAIISCQPFYQADNGSFVYVTMSGLIKLTSAQTVSLIINRSATGSANKLGDVTSLTLQKIAQS